MTHRRSLLSWRTENAFASALLASPVKIRRWPAAVRKARELLSADGNRTCDITVEGRSPAGADHQRNARLYACGTSAFLSQFQGLLLQGQDSTRGSLRCSRIDTSDSGVLSKNDSASPGADCRAVSGSSSSLHLFFFSTALRRVKWGSERSWCGLPASCMRYLSGEERCDQDRSRRNSNRIRQVRLADRSPGISGPCADR